MKKSKRISKSLNIFSIILELACEIVLLPFHVLKAISDVITELRK